MPIFVALLAAPSPLENIHYDAVVANAATVLTMEAASSKRACLRVYSHGREFTCGKYQTCMQHQITAMKFVPCMHVNRTDFVR